MAVRNLLETSEPFQYLRRGYRKAGEGHFKRTRGDGSGNDLKLKEGRVR